MTEHEQRLPGGRVTGAVRIGDTVRRPAAHGDPAFVRALLLFLERTGWNGAPRFSASMSRAGRS